MASDINERQRAVVARRADYRCEYCLIREAPLTPIGKATVLILRLNEPERLAERHVLQELGTYPTD